MRDGGHVGNQRDLEIARGERADRGFSARPGALYVNLYASQAVFLSGLRGSLRSHLRGKRGALTAALISEGACARPGYGVSVGVRDGDQRVIEGGLDMNLPFIYFFKLLTLTRSGCLLSVFIVCHNT